jgi:hypothetical protein
MDKATAKDIILAIVDNMRESTEPLVYSSVVASIYDVYLNTSDYDRLAGLFPKMREEASRALTEELGRSGAKERSFFGGPKRKREKRESAEGDWQVAFHRDEDDELAPGDILVDSRLMMPPQTEYGVGSKTQRTLTLRSGGETRKLRKSEEQPQRSEALARLAYQDKHGERREYLMTLPEIAIGRGGRAEFCDLELEAPPDISRQHCYLRKDETTREFFIQDVSKFGTTVNGHEIAPKQWVRIPARATIGLANKLVIDFESL